jgi:HSP20 family protein
MQEHIETQNIPVKVFRSGERLTVAAPMPGLVSDDITVEVTAENHLILDGKLRGALKGVNDLLIDEWSVGGYHRDLALPEIVDGPTANVTYGNGVLVVAMMLSDQPRPAMLTLTPTGPSSGQRFGNAGHHDEDIIVEIDEIAIDDDEAIDPNAG